MRLRLLALTTLAAVALPAVAGAPYLVKDIEPSTTSASSDPSIQGSVGGRAFLVANDGVAGFEPWISDGTANGTTLLADICPGTCSSAARFLASNGTQLFFSAFSDSESQGLWVTDGTPNGTLRLTGSPFYLNFRSAPAAVSAVSGKLVYFLANDFQHGEEVWRSDGTPAGTYQIADLHPGLDGAAVTDLVALGRKLIFVADDGRGAALWSTNGTSSGTRLLLDPDPSSSTNAPPANLVHAGRYVYFTANAAGLGDELWRTDGTPAGTVNVVDLASGPRSLQYLGGNALGQQLLFVAAQPDRSQQLWVTDGTAAGTRALTAFSNPRPFVIVPPEPGSRLPLDSLGDSALLGIDDGRHGFEPWITNGTPQGTRQAADVCPGSCSGWAGFAGDHFASRTFFRGDDGVRGAELWITDGTAHGTHITRDLCQGPCNGGSSFGRTFGVGQAIVFAFLKPGGGTELWSSNGSTRGTFRLAVVGPADLLHGGLRVAAAGGALVFAGADPEHGTELWRSDGTPRGTGLLRDINQKNFGAESQEP